VGGCLHVCRMVAGVRAAWLHMCVSG
jgi:hypothetical protein